VNHFFAYLYRLRFIQRWSLMRSAVPENVAEHSFHVALLAHALCTIGRQVFGRGVPTERVVTLALFHDAEEVITGDIPTPVKHHNQKLLRSLRRVETLASERLLGMVPAPLLETYRPLLHGPERDPELLAWVKAADKLDAYLKCAMELAVGNREFAGQRPSTTASLPVRSNTADLSTRLLRPGARLAPNLAQDLARAKVRLSY
jgi:5'-deoxynucleotidase